MDRTVAFGRHDHQLAPLLELQYPLHRTKCHPPIYLPPSAHISAGLAIPRSNPQLTMKLINSETHSWTHSLASFETFAVVGKLDFMIRETFAIWRQSRFARLDGPPLCPPSSSI